jgi:hypothetical protein
MADAEDAPPKAHKVFRWQSPGRDDYSEQEKDAAIAASRIKPRSPAAADAACIDIKKKIRRLVLQFDIMRAVARDIRDGKR